MRKVSIVVPIYNGVEFLNKCIDSLLNQTLKDIEIILINDGSTDNSDKIVKKYKDERIIYISKNNEGIGKTRNKGIDIATGEYITFVDADDYISTRFCQKMYEKALKDDCDLVICNYYNVNGNTKILKKFKEFDDSNIINNPKILLNINFGPCNKLFKTSLIKENKIKFIENLKYEDVPFVAKSLQCAKKVGYLNEPLSYFTIHSGSQTTIRDEKIFDIFKITDKVINIFTNKEYSREVKCLVISNILDYTVQTRYIKDRKVRNKFINMAYSILNTYEKNWKDYILNPNPLKKLTLKNKWILKVYCDLYKR
jgi:glycosyltransferase EpsH